MEQLAAYATVAGGGRVEGGRKLKECCTTGYTRPREIKTPGKARSWKRRT